MDLFYYLLSSLGLMFILKYGSILDKPRCYVVTRSKFFKELFCCSLCLGFWTGLMIMVYCYFVLGKFDNRAYLFPFASAAFCWVIDIVKEWFRKP